MKQYRVTLKCSLNGQPSTLSTTIPAYNSNSAIDKVIDANNLVGQVMASSAEEIK